MPSPNLLIINQYYPPDRAATALLLGQLSETLKKTFNVHVVCAKPSYAPEMRETDTLAHHISRVWVPRGGKKNFLTRLLNYFFFSVGALWSVLKHRRMDIIMVWSDPPWLAIIALIAKIKHRCPIVFVSQDVYPDILFAQPNRIIKLGAPWVGKAVSFMHKRVSHMVVIGQDMAQVYQKKVHFNTPLSVIQNWQDENQLCPVEQPKLREAWGFKASDFLVMHSGNIGISQDLLTFLKSADILKSQPHIKFVIVGEGNAKAALKTFAEVQHLHNVIFFPYQTSVDLSDSLASADLHYISLKAQYAGLIVPSKTYGILAVGKAYIALVPKNSEVARITTEAKSGYLIHEYTPELLAQHILNAFGDPSKLKQMGQSGYNWFLNHATRRISMQRYEKLLNDLIGTQKIS